MEIGNGPARGEFREWANFLVETIRRLSREVEELFSRMRGVEKAVPDALDSRLRSVEGSIKALPENLDARLRRLEGQVVRLMAYATLAGAVGGSIIVEIMRRSGH